MLLRGGTTATVCISCHLVIVSTISCVCCHGHCVDMVLHGPATATVCTSCHVVVVSATAAVWCHNHCMDKLLPRQLSGRAAPWWYHCHDQHQYHLMAPLDKQVVPLLQCGQAATYRGVDKVLSGGATTVIGANVVA